MKILIWQPHCRGKPFAGKWSGPPGRAAPITFFGHNYTLAKSLLVCAPRDWITPTCSVRYWLQGRDNQMIHQSGCISSSINLDWVAQHSPGIYENVREGGSLCLASSNLPTDRNPEQDPGATASVQAEQASKNVKFF